MPRKATDKNDFVCLKEGCGEHFTTPWGRSRHHKVCNRPPAYKEYAIHDDKSIKCKQCNKSFGTVPNVLKHIRVVHSNQKKRKRKVRNMRTVPRI